MKNGITLVIALFLTTFAFANNPTYEIAMQTALKKVNVGHPIWTEVAEDFETIVANNPTKWLPLYYHALANTNASFDVDLTQKDAYLDKAQASLDKVLAMQPDEVEITVLQANIYIMRIAVEPNSRGMAYSSKVFGALSKAKIQNTENPRIYVLWGLMVYNMPEQFGGGALAASAYFNTAKAKFATFEAASELHPNWGETSNNKMLASYK
jgi:hypothetical protein